MKLPHDTMKQRRNRSFGAQSARSRASSLKQEDYMYELIKIENTAIGSETVPTVNARELYEFLGSQRQFSDWVKKRIEKLRLLENKDFCSVSQKNETLNSKGKKGVSVSIEYFLTLDVAKHIALMENTDRGFEVRDYFIQCEKQLKEARATEKQLILNTVLANSIEERMLALGEYRTAIVQPLLEFKEQALPKVSYYDNVLNSPGLVTITQIAKDYGMTAIDFNKLLESLHIQYKQSRQWLLYHHYAKEGYTQSSTYVTEYGYSKLTTKWTQKGRLFIYEKLKSEGILPICERE